MGRKLFALAAALLLLFTGCDRLSAALQPTGQPQDTPTAAPTDPPAQDPALAMLRQAMAGSNELFAVAYLGQVDEPTDIISYIRENNPQLLRSYPFIAQIPQARILGATGEIYCIIPRDKSAGIRVIRSVWEAPDQVSAETIYRANSGNPFILLCSDLDCYISVESSAGDFVGWTPGIDDSFTVSLPWDPDKGVQAWDISLYEAGPRDIYHSWYADGWTLPYEEDLSGTQWAFTGTGPDGREAQCQLILNRNGSATFSWQYTGSSTQEYYQGTWNAWLEHRAFLRLDLRRTGGVLHQGGSAIADSFAVLLSPDGRQLLLGFAYDGSRLPLDPVEKNVLAVFDRFGR